MPHLLILGGTREASALAEVVAARGIAATLSYAGRVAHPKPQPVRTRTGGFGGAEAMAAWLGQNGISHVVDATHPFADRISGNAVRAAAAAGAPLIALTRPAWAAGLGDRWIDAPDMAAAVQALAGPPRRVMLAIGRGGVADFAVQPRHFYLLRFVDPPETPPPLPDCAVVVDRGPFTEAGDKALMQRHRIDLVVAKNAGGDGARAKLDAARALGLPVVMIARPPTPPRLEATTPEEVLAWLDRAHETADRGV